MSKVFRNLGFSNLTVGATVLFVPNVLFYSQTGISISADATTTVSVPDLFFSATGTLVNRRGEMTIVALSRSMNSVKIAKYGVSSFRDGSTSHNALGTVFAQASCETGNSNTGGANITAVRNVNNLDVTLDLTDGSSAITDGEIYVYLSRFP